MSILIQIRTFLQSHQVTHWQYLLLGFFLAIISSISWFYMAAIFQLQLAIFAILIGLIQGLLAYLFMSKKGEVSKVFFALLFSFFAYFLGKYLLFEHFDDWYLSAYIDKSTVNFELVMFYLTHIDFISLNLFFTQYFSVFSVYDVIWISLLILGNQQYYFFDFNYNNQDGSLPKSSRKFGKRRFE